MDRPVTYTTIKIPSIPVDDAWIRSVFATGIFAFFVWFFAFFGGAVVLAIYTGPIYLVLDIVGVTDGGWRHHYWGVTIAVFYMIPLIIMSLVLIPAHLWAKAILHPLDTAEGLGEDGHVVRLETDVDRTNARKAMKMLDICNMPIRFVVGLTWGFIDHNKKPMVLLAVLLIIAAFWTDWAIVKVAALTCFFWLLTKSQVAFWRAWSASIDDSMKEFDRRF